MAADLIKESMDLAGADATASDTADVVIACVHVANEIGDEAAVRMIRAMVALRLRAGSPRFAELLRGMLAIIQARQMPVRAVGGLCEYAAALSRPQYGLSTAAILDELKEVDYGR